MSASLFKKYWQFIAVAAIRIHAKKAAANKPSELLQDRSFHISQTR